MTEILHKRFSGCFRPRLLLWLLTSTLIYLFCVYYASPLINCEGYDSCIFKLLGLEMINGGTLYADLFDHKGPLLFMFQAAGLYFGDYVYVGEIILYACCMELVWRMCRLLGLSAARSAATEVVTLLFYLYYLEGGNTSEEWALPFNYLALCMCVADVMRGKVGEKAVRAYVYGLCFGITSMTRLNNAGVAAGVILACAVMLVSAREYRLLLKNALACLAGILTVIVPLSVYFLAKGAFADMVFGSFTFNFLYLAAWSDIQPTYTSLWLKCFYRAVMVALPLLTCFYAGSRRRQMMVLTAVCSVVVFIATWSTINYPHYFISTMPLISLAMIIFFCVCRNRYAAASVSGVVILAVGYLYSALFVKAVSNNILFSARACGESRLQADRLRQIRQLIPPQYDNSVYMIGDMADPMLFFINYRITPSIRYFTHVYSLAGVSGDIRDEVENAFRHNPPEYILFSGDYVQDYFPLDKAKFYYEEAGEFGSVKVWKLNYDKWKALNQKYLVSP